MMMSILRHESGLEHAAQSGLEHAAQSSSGAQEGRRLESHHQSCSKACQHTHVLGSWFQLSLCLVA